MKEALEKLKEEYGTRIWTHPIKNQFIKYVVYFDSYIIGGSDTPYEVFKKAIKYYI